MTNKDGISTYYDQYWDRENVSTWTPPVSRWPDDRFARAFGCLRNQSPVLDVGCGDGTTYQSQLQSIVGELWGIDASPQALKAVQARGVRTLVCKLDSENFPLGDSEFAGATCIEVFEHLFDPLFAARQIFRVLKPDGLLVTSVPNFSYFANRLEVLFRARLQDSPFDLKNPWAGAHIRFFSPRSFKKMLRAAGFEIVRVIPAGDCSIFDFLWVVARLVPLSLWIKDHIPGVLRLKFLEEIFPALFAQHLLVIARKP